MENPTVNIALSETRLLIWLSQQKYERIGGNGSTTFWDKSEILEAFLFSCF
jgi:hypothetical protein